MTSAAGGSPGVSDTNLDGRQTVQQATTGQRTWDFNKDGVAQYGLYPDWIEDLRKIAGDGIVEDLAPVDLCLELGPAGEPELPGHGQQRHHLLDPRTGLPTTGPWRSVSQKIEPRVSCASGFFQSDAWLHDEPALESAVAALARATGLAVVPV